VKFGAPRDTDHPELRQPQAMEIWESILQTLKPGSNITVLTNGPLTNLAKVVSVKNISSRIQVSDLYICFTNFVIKHEHQQQSTE
jgi:inosine-uridine nucleoside N-ribohydrolase